MTFSLPEDCYAESIAAAWQIVEHMQSEKWYVDLWFVFREWGARFIDSKHPYGVFQVTADTAPHAIVLAALRAVGVEVPD